FLHSFIYPDRDSFSSLPLTQPWTFSALCPLYAGRILLLLLGCQTCFATIGESYDQQRGSGTNLNSTQISSLIVRSCPNSLWTWLLPRPPSTRKSLKLLHKIPESSTQHLLVTTHPPAPPAPSSLTAEDFATFYTEKIERICQTFTSPPTSSTSHSQHSATPSLTQLSTVATEEVLQFIRSCNPTTCPLDPIPSAMLQAISPDLLPFITTVINGSLTSGHVPTVFKKAKVIPILKKPALDRSDISNYRPESWNLWNSMGMVCFLPGWSLISDTMVSARISACLVDISSWMTAHQLKLNPSKTELLVIPGDPSPAQDLAISLNNSMISPSATAHNLGPMVQTTALTARKIRQDITGLKPNKAAVTHLLELEGQSRRNFNESNFEGARQTNTNFTGIPMLQRTGPCEYTEASYAMDEMRRIIAPNNHQYLSEVKGYSRVQFYGVMKPPRTLN
ncbi:hypothetical protein QTP70_025793, partial [Hemibagrus guttatus]